MAARQREILSKPHNEVKFETRISSITGFSGYNKYKFYVTNVANDAAGCNNTKDCAAIEHYGSACGYLQCCSLVNTQACST